MLQLLVRQHPAERLAIGSTSDDYRDLLESFFGFNDRIRLIHASDHVNSYELIDRVKMVLVASTTFGVEAAALGAPVLTSANCYYSTMDFVYSAKTKEKYFQLLYQLSSDTFSHVLEIDNAYLCFYLTQNCNWVWSDIYPEDVSEWLGDFSFDKCKADVQLQNELTAIIDGIPISHLNHLDMLRSAG